MNHEINEIAQRIKGLREACGYTREALAEELNLDLAVYADYEDSGENIPISVIYEIANKFGVDFTEIITGVGAKLDTYHVVRWGAGKSIDRYPGYRFEDLAFRYSHKIMQPLLVTIDPSEDRKSMSAHKGEEFNMILSGSIKLIFDDEEIVLHEGDCIYFDSTHPHRQLCASDKPATFFTMIAE